MLLAERDSVEIGDVDPDDRIDYFDYLQRAGLAHMNVSIVGKPMKLSKACPRSKSVQPEPDIVSGTPDTTYVTSDEYGVTTERYDVTTERTEAATERHPSGSFVPSEGSMAEQLVCMKM